jgi:hypothetical protein
MEQIVPNRRSTVIRAALCLLVVLLGFGSTAPAGAATVYPLPTRGQGTVSSTSVHAGDCVIFSGSGFAPNTPLTLTDNGKVVGHTRSDGIGDFSAKVCFPTTARLGKHTLEAAGRGANGAARVVFASVTVLGVVVTRPGTVGPGGTLPFTGSDILSLLGLGLFLVLLGAVLVWRNNRAGERRRAARLTA